MQPSSLHKTFFEYKAWANDEIFNVILSIDESAFPEIIHSAVRVLNHAYVVDEIFKNHLLKNPHEHTATNTQETPSAKLLFSKVRELDAWYISYISNLEENTLKESIEFIFTDGEKGRMTREEILFHIITHGGYHRGQAGQIIRAASVVLPPRDIFTRFLHSSEHSRRERSA